MKKWRVLAFLSAGVLLMNSFTSRYAATGNDPYADSLRALYAKPAAAWPAPQVDKGVAWQELGVLPDSPLKPYADSLQALTQLGKLLFFDPRLSSSGQISCASCHIPDLSWADGREKAVGHDQQVNTRNTPSLQNIWYAKKLFWDGRSNSLEEQVFSPVNNPAEMHGDMRLLSARLDSIAGYHPLFGKAFGNNTITAARIAKAIALYEQTITGRKTRFDLFVEGNEQMLSDQELRGLHLFRTKARCMNCHYGPLLTDNDFHNIGLTYYGRTNEDLGLYNTTKRAADVGKFKTPSLRDVLRTRPWMHNGLFDNIEGVMNMYSAGMPQPKPKPGQLSDTLFPKTDVLIQRLDLSREEKQALIAFLQALTTEPWKVRMPVLPQ